MCIAIPGRVLDVNGNRAMVDFFGKKLTVDCRYVKVKKDDFVLTFGSHIIDVVSEDVARETAKLLGMIE